jgi:hypothetical protein
MGNQRRPLIPHQALDRLVVLRRFPRLQWDGYTLYVGKGAREEELRMALDGKPE